MGCRKPGEESSVALSLFRINVTTLEKSKGTPL
jgi:hypothetical protein